MVKLDLIKKLVELYKSNDVAPLFFEELASLRSPKPNIDIERRRMSINARHNLKLNRNQALPFFEALATLKLGKLKVIQERSQGNSHFEWTYYESDCVDLARAVLDSVKTEPSPRSSLSRNQDSISRNSISHNTPHPEPQESISGPAVGGQGDSYICRLSNGQILRLSMCDMRELQEFIRSVL